VGARQLLPAAARLDPNPGEFGGLALALSLTGAKNRTQRRNVADVKEPQVVPRRFKTFTCQRLTDTHEKATTTENEDKTSKSVRVTAKQPRQEASETCSTALGRQRGGKSRSQK